MSGIKIWISNAPNALPKWNRKKTRKPPCLYPCEVRRSRKHQRHCNRRVAVDDQGLWCWRAGCCVYDLEADFLARLRAVKTIGVVYFRNVFGLGECDVCALICCQQAVVDSAILRWTYVVQSSTVLCRFNYLDCRIVADLGCVVCR